MGDFGIKVSQKGYNVSNCADYQLLFSSAFPTLKIAYQGSFQITDATQDVVIKEHNLGFPAVFMTTIDVGGSAESLSFGINRTDCFGITDNALKWYGNTLGASAGSLTGYYYIYYYSLLTNFTAPIIDTGISIKNIENDYGIKVSLPDKKITSKDYRDFVIHSSCRYPVIHNSTYIAPSSFTTVTINHKLGYTPNMLSFFNTVNAGYTPSSPNAWMVTRGVAGWWGFNADQTSVEVNVSGGVQQTVLILKDPFLTNY